MKIYVCDDLGCVYRAPSVEGGEVEYAPLMSDGTFETDDFTPVEEALVGDELVTFGGVELPLSSVYRIVEGVVCE